MNQRDLTVEEQMELAKSDRERLEANIKTFQDLNNLVRMDIFKGSGKLFLEGLKKDTLNDMKEEFIVDKTTGEKKRIDGNELLIRQAVHNRVVALLDPFERPETYLKTALDNRAAIDKSIKELKEYQAKEAEKIETVKTE